MTRTARFVPDQAGEAVVLNAGDRTPERVEPDRGIMGLPKDELLIRLASII